MSETFEQILRLIDRGDVKVSDHGYDELAADGLSARDALVSVRARAIVEDYPDYLKGPCVLVLQKDRQGGDPPSHDRDPFHRQTYPRDPGRKVHR